LRRLLRIQACSLVLSFVLLHASGAAHADDRVRVALLPLVIHSADGREYLQQGLGDMLVARLARTERLAVVPIDDPKTATADVAAARETGLANGAAFVVYGSFTRFGEGASLELLCANVRDDKSEPRRIYVHADSIGNLLPLLDGVAERTTYAVLGPPPEGSDVSTAPTIVDPAAPAPSREPVPKQVDQTDISIGNRDGERRAPGLPSDREEDFLR
jgi:TolB-like protein